MHLARVEWLYFSTRARLVNHEIHENHERLMIKPRTPFATNAQGGKDSHTLNTQKKSLKHKTTKYTKNTKG